MMTTTSTPRVYVASLSDYNAGNLHGEWIELTGDVDELRESIAAMLATSPKPLAEEWAVHDYDDFPNMGEYPDLEKLSNIATALIEANENGLGDAYTAWLDDNNGYDSGNFRDAYQGTFEDTEDYAYQYAESTGMIKQLEDIGMKWHVNWSSYGDDLLQGMTVMDAPGVGIYVFNPNV